MAFLTTVDTKAPDVAPTTSGTFWLNTLTGAVYAAVGESSVDDWILITNKGAVTDNGVIFGFDSSTHTYLSAHGDSILKNIAFSDSYFTVGEGDVLLSVEKNGTTYDGRYSRDAGASWTQIASFIDATGAGDTPDTIHISENKTVTDTIVSYYGARWYRTTTGSSFTQVTPTGNAVTEPTKFFYVGNRLWQMDVDDMEYSDNNATNWSAAAGLAAANSFKDVAVYEDTGRIFLVDANGSGTPAVYDTTTTTFASFYAPASNTPMAVAVDEAKGRLLVANLLTAGDTALSFYYYDIVGAAEITGRDNITGLPSLTTADNVQLVHNGEEFILTVANTTVDVYASPDAKTWRTLNINSNCNLLRQMKGNSLW